jgi:N-acyl-D-aspartate/D-glutamate deacylase
MFDIVIENGRVLDGSGNPWFTADVGVQDGKVAKIGRLKGESARERIDAAGRYVAPGFIDIHSHSDALPFLKPYETAKLMQGVTTETVGNCGISVMPVSREHLDLLKKYCSSILTGVSMPWDWKGVDDYLRRVEAERPVGNVATLVGHGTVRIAVMGFVDREPVPSELEQMKTLVAQAMDEGAFGMSTGLIYPPGVYSRTAELVELGKVVAGKGGIYTSHIRDETDAVIAAVKEALEVGKQAGVPVQISHHKTAGRTNWGKSRATLHLIDEARLQGIDVTCDAYPYIAGSTMLGALLPPWAQEGGVHKMLDRLKAPENRTRITRELDEGLPGWQNFYKASGWDKIMLAAARTNKSYEGQSLAQIAEQRKGDPAEVLFDILLEEEGDALMVLFMMSEDDVTNILKHPAVMVGSDGIYSSGKPHPRYHGTFPRILRKYVREDRALALPDAIRKMSSFPAWRLGLRDRGLLAKGAWADVVVFDLAVVEDTATFLEPLAQPRGIEYVLVNGQVAVRQGRFTGAAAGRVLRKTA